MTDQEKINIDIINQIVYEVTEKLSYIKGETKEEKEKKEQLRQKTLLEVDFDYL